MREKPRAKKNLTEGPIIGPLLTLSLPIMASSAMQTAYNVADTFWLGRVGAEAVAALSIGWPLIFLLISIAAGLSMAGTTLVAQYTGANESEKANHVAGQVFILLLILGVSFAIIGVVVARPLLVLMGTPDEVLPLAVVYSQIIFGGVVLMFGSFIFQSIISGYGDTVTPMKLMFVSVVLNIVLDPILIFGAGPLPKMGVAGAAIATVFSRGVASFIGFYFLFTGSKGIIIRPQDLIPRPADLKKVIQIGVPSAIEQSTLALGFTFMAAVVAQFGTVALASYGIGSRLISILSMPAMGFSMAVSIMVGQNLGAGREQRAERVGWLSSGAIFLILTLGGVVAFVFSRPLVSIFIVQEDLAVVEMGSRFIKFIALGMGTFGIRLVLNGVFRGAGDTITSLGFSLLALWGFRIPLVLVLSSNMGTDGVWLGILLSYIITPVLALLWFKRGKWKEKSISGRGWEPPKTVEVDLDVDPDG